MKKRSLVLLVVLLLSFALVGCGNKGTKSDLEGTTWKMTLAKASGIEISAEDMGMGDFTLKFKADGVVNASAAGENSEGTYKDSDDEVTIELDGDDMILKIDGDTMSMDQDGTTLYFEKQ